MFALVYRLIVQALDNGTPSKFDTTVATITVNRNRFGPEFNPRDYNKRILETQVRLIIYLRLAFCYCATETIAASVAGLFHLQAVGVPIVTVRAQDRDGDEVRYRLIGDGNSQSFFTVNTETGEISVRQDLRLDNRQTYTVRVEHMYN